MANRKRSFDNGGDAEVSPPVAASKPEPRKVKMGDIVLYAHRRGGFGSDGKDYVTIPMMVTRVYFDSLTIGGVVFSENPAICPSSGAKIVNSAQFGEGGGTWQWRD